MREEIIQCITEFIEGGDESNVQKLDNALHKYYRNVQSGFFDKKGIFIIDKNKYLSLIEEGTFGGTPRKMEILSIEINGDIACATINLEGESLIFKSWITLIKDSGKWFVIGNYPHIEMKNLMK